MAGSLAIARPLPRSAKSALPRRCYSTSSPSILASIQTLKDRPAKLIPDYLVPMQSHLLDTTLSDLLPSASQPPSTPIITSPARRLPPGHHLVYFPIQLPPSRLIPDGADPDHSPGPPFERRMWAGGEVVFNPGSEGLVLDGKPWICREHIENAEARGPEGQEKIFVDVKRRYGLGHDDLDHENHQGSSWLIEERRTLVFMRNQEPASSAGAPIPRLIKSPYDPTFSVTMTPSPIHLFHFSALTFNAHAIHVDRLYAQHTDGYRTLLVHGPLTLALMLRVLASQVGNDALVTSLSYRNHAPLYVDEPMTVCVRKPKNEQSGSRRWDVWVEGPERGLAVKGSAVVANV